MNVQNDSVTRVYRVTYYALVLSESVTFPCVTIQEAYFDARSWSQIYPNWKIIRYSDGVVLAQAK